MRRRVLSSPSFLSVLFAFLIPLHGTNSPNIGGMQLASAKNTACPIPCHNGKCVEIEVGISYKCECDKADKKSMIGYDGPSCDIPYNLCPDDERKCFNNAECKVSDNSGKYICDCSKAFSVSSFAGHECEYSATAVCEVGTPVSDDAFCVNGGTCREFVLEGELHPGCDCPEEFEGSKCQYLKGTAPEEDGGTAFSFATGKSSGEKMNPGIVALIVIIVLGAVIGLGLLVYLKVRSNTGGEQDSSDKADLQTSGESTNGGGDGFQNDETADLELQPDGSASFGTDSPVKKELDAEAKLENPLEEAEENDDSKEII